MVVGVGFEPTYATRADLQSAAFNHSATPPNFLEFYYFFIGPVSCLTIFIQTVIIPVKSRNLLIYILFLWKFKSFLCIFFIDLCSGLFGLFLWLLVTLILNYFQICLFSGNELEVPKCHFPRQN